jgi:hypothetical protein
MLRIVKRTRQVRYQAHCARELQMELSALKSHKALRGGV